MALRYFQPRRSPAADESRLGLRTTRSSTTLDSFFPKTEKATLLLPRTNWITAGSRNSKTQNRLTIRVLSGFADAFRKPNARNSVQRWKFKELDFLSSFRYETFRTTCINERASNRAQRSLRAKLLQTSSKVSINRNDFHESFNRSDDNRWTTR